MGSASFRSGDLVKHEKFKLVKLHFLSKMKVTCFVENRKKFRDWVKNLKRINNSEMKETVLVPWES